MELITKSARFVTHCWINRQAVKLHPLCAAANGEARITAMTTLLGKTEDELIEFAKQFGEPAFRGKQLYQWIYARRAVVSRR